MGFSKLQVYTSLLIVSVITIICADDLSSSINTLSKNFYKTIVKDDNLIFSPFSLHAALSLLYGGTGGRTTTTFQKALDLPTINETALVYKPVFDNLNSAKNITINIANKIYLHKGKTLKNSFKSTAQTYFNADVDSIDFGNGVEAAAEINNWVKEKTHDKIQGVVSPDSFDPLTQVVLINAIYFKGKWLLPFSPNNTQLLEFHVSKTKVIPHPMMHQKNTFYYAFYKELNAQILKLEYKNQRFAMTIILPGFESDINDLEKKLSNIDLNNLTTKQEEVEVYIPQFKIENTFDLHDPLQKIGLGEIFDEADFSNMINGVPDLTIDKVIHKAFIEVNEDGTEAAAVTASSGGVISAELPQNLVFNANQPFIYFLTAKLSEEPSADSTVLFVGKVTSPKYEEEAEET